jgi:hypothetical protein
MTSTLEKERLKYEKVWKHPHYSVQSPGYRSVGHFVDCYLEQAGGYFREEIVVDLGCGTGRAANAMRDDFEVKLFDIVNANETDLPLELGCLWSDELPEGDIAFCCDVLEHIPPQYIDEALDNIQKTYKYGYLKVHLKEDNFGKKGAINEELHLTVRPYEWWLQKMEERFDVRIAIEDFPNAIFYVAQKDQGETDVKD